MMIQSEQKTAIEDACIKLNISCNQCKDLIVKRYGINTILYLNFYQANELQEYLEKRLRAKKLRNKFLSYFKEKLINKKFAG